MRLKGSRHILQTSSKLSVSASAPEDEIGGEEMKFAIDSTSGSQTLFFMLF